MQNYTILSTNSPYPNLYNRMADFLNHPKYESYISAPYMPVIPITHVNKPIGAIRREAMVERKKRDVYTTPQADYIYAISFLKETIDYTTGK